MLASITKAVVLNTDSIETPYRYLKRRGRIAAVSFISRFIIVVVQT